MKGKSMERYCLTYFLVQFGDNFNLRDFCSLLGLSLGETERFSTECTLEIGRNEFFDMDVNVMLRKTLKDLLGKEKQLLALKERYGLTYYLERVPSLQANSEAPNQCLSLAPDVIEFLYKTQTVDDLDYYIL